MAAVCFQKPEVVISQLWIEISRQNLAKSIKMKPEVHCANFLAELRQISTNFGKFWQKDGTKARIMRDALIFHLT